MANPATQFERNADYPAVGRSALDPPPFPAAVHHPCTRISTRIFDPSVNEVSTAERVLVTAVRSLRAYRLEKTLQTAIYGKVVSAVGLKRRMDEARDGAEWERTEDRFAVKEFDWQKINSRKELAPEDLCEDPLKEVEAMQFLKSRFEEKGLTEAAAAERAMLKTNVMMPVEVLSDDRFLYVVMPYCDGGEMFDVLEDSEKFTEGEARYWIHQILNGLETMQRAGICHRDLSLENLLVHKRSCVIIDMGMCLRIPEEEDEGTARDAVTAGEDAGNSGNAGNSGITAAITAASGNDSTPSIPDLLVVDSGDSMDEATVEATGAATARGSVRRLRRWLIKPSGTCGKSRYRSPEIGSNSIPFDGHAVDMWAVGVMMFMMLTGCPPWDNPMRSDARFRFITSGGLQRLLTEWTPGLTEDAMDLMQRMLRRDPRKRLSLAQVRSHRWMANGHRVPPVDP